MFYELIRKYNLEISYLISLTAVTGSLTLSIVFNWVPFDLALIERVFMYPLPFLIALNIKNNLDYLTHSILSISIIGGITAFFNFILVLLDPTIRCGYAIPCHMPVRIELMNYILQPVIVPFMAFLAFTAISCLVYLEYKDPS